VGVYFVTQNPLDVPDSVLAQLGNRVQHALRAFTPRDQKAVKAAATTFRQNPAFDTEKAITELGKGEALVSVLDPKGVPSMVERTLIRPPSGRMGPVSEAERQATVKSSPLYGQYDTAIDRESAYEKLQAKAGAAAKRKEDEAAAKQAQAEERQARTGSRDSITDRIIRNAAGSAARTVGTIVVREVTKSITGSGRGASSTIVRQIGGALVRGILGSLTRR
jgi:DNA helicase HerA-like ATPase